MLPAFSHFYGLKPWEVCGGPEELTLAEITEYRDQYRAWVKANTPKKGGR